MVVDKKFQDKNYAPHTVTQETKSVYARSEPINDSEYTQTIAEYRNGNVVDPLIMDLIIVSTELNGDIPTRTRSK